MNKTKILIVGIVAGLFPWVFLFLIILSILTVTQAINVGIKELLPLSLFSLLTSIILSLGYNYLYKKYKVFVTIALIIVIFIYISFIMFSYYSFYLALGWLSLGG